jgi:hypothetical protein
MSRRFLFAALATIATASSARPLAEGQAWNCRFTASFACGPAGCSKVAPPAYIGVFTPGDYWRCADLPFCADQPRAAVRPDGDMWVADLPQAGLTARLSDGRISETVTRDDRTIASFGSCRIGLAAVITRVAPRQR